MTPYEEQQMRAAIMRQTQKPIPQGMINQSANAGAQKAFAQQSQDISGAERRVKSQRDFANQIRGNKAPKGQSVGPLGVYVGPNWGESLAYAGEQALGGYMAGRANKQDTELDAKRSDIAAAKAAQEQANTDRTFGQKDRGLGLTLQGLEQDAYQFTQTLGLEREGLEEDIRAAGVEEGIAERKVAAEEAKLETRPMLDTEGTNRNVRTMADPNNPGQFVTVDENNEVVDITGWQENDPRTGSSSSSSPYGRIYAPKRHVDAEGNPYTIGTTADGRFWDVDAQELIPQGDFTKMGLVAEAPMSQFQLNKAVTAYKEADTDQRRLLHDIEAAEETWTGNGWSPGEEPPLGFFTKQDNVIGGLARYGSDLMEEGAPAGDNYAAAKTVTNTITRLRAGLSQTITEVENIKKETGLDVLSDPEVFMRYWGRLKKFVDADRLALQEGLSPTVRKELKRRKDAAGKGKKPPGLSAAEWEELKALEAAQK